MSNVTELVPANFSHGSLPEPPSHFEVVGSVVQTEGGPSFQKISVVLRPGHEVRPGELLAVWHGRRGSDSMTVLQVENCVENNPSETPDLAHARRTLDLGDIISGEATSTRIYRVASCGTKEDLLLVPGSPPVASAPELLCRASDPVVRLPPALMTAALGALDDVQQGLHLGTLAGTDVPVVLTPDILQVHLGVFGNPGKGKSYLSGVLIEEIADWNVPAIVLDVNGEMVDAVKALGGKIISLPNKSEFGLALNKITGKELASITPQVDLGSQYAQLIESAHDALRTQRSEQALRTHQPLAEITIDDLIEKITTFSQSSRAQKASSEIALARARRLSESRLIGASFPFIEELKTHRLICLDCRRLQLNETRLVAAAASRELQNYGSSCARKAEEGKASQDEADWLSILFVDEAHNIVPESERTVTSNVLQQLARMGRHFRTGLILASQSPADLDSSILQRMQTRFIFSLEQNQLRAIAGVKTDLGEELTLALPKLGRGTCAVSGNGDQIRHGFLLKVRERRTPVGGGTPPVFSKRVKSTLSQDL